MAPPTLPASDADAGPRASLHRTLWTVLTLASLDEGTSMAARDGTRVRALPDVAWPHATATIG